MAKCSTFLILLFIGSTLGKLLTYWENKYFILLAKLAGLPHAKKNQAEERIIGIPYFYVKNANIQDFKYVVSIRNYGSDIHNCVGSILALRIVLTAAHCISYPNPTPLQILAGTSDLQNTVGAQIIDVLEQHRHPSFTLETIEYDIGILVLAIELIFNSKVAAITLASIAYPVSTPGTVAGW